MGCGFSRTSSGKCRNRKNNLVRVVHLNGEVEDFDYPVSVEELTLKLPKHFVCTHCQLLSPCAKPLAPTDRLEPGRVYFLLPFSFFQSNFSPKDLITIARKLNAFAKSAKPAVSRASDQNPGSSPNRNHLNQNTVCGLQMRMEREDVMQKSCQLRSWKPILSTIRERSFNRRSESELQIAR